MKKKHLFIIILLCLGCVQIPVQGQNLSHFAKVHGSLKLRGNGGYVALYAAAYTTMATMLLEEEDLTSVPVARWLLPTAELDAHLPAWSLSRDGTDIPLGAPKWWTLLYPNVRNNYNFSVGYELSAKFFRLPLGLYAGADFEWRNVNIQTGGVLSGLHKMTSFLPSAGIRIRVLGNGFERRHNWNIVLDCGTYYNLPLRYRSFTNWNTAEALGKGFRPRVGLIFSTVHNGSYYIRWEKDMYDLFNQDFTLPDGRKPFDGIHSSFYSIIFGFSLFV